ncbi:hypothetical protein E2C01_043147 [Portunus trituberculatus]|uniref:Uncharacterized protein n=1 Tax=Portunus trituberculatus TaxID=210409 RepID=A0A5B7FWQ5_PORTR|nr:hypothetical protein [Portunus trituberculatus]
MKMCLGVDVFCRNQYRDDNDDDDGSSGTVVMFMEMSTCLSFNEPNYQGQMWRGKAVMYEHPVH